MTVALYQDFVRVAAFLIGIGSIWIAVFMTCIWLLHYEPVKITPLPKSRRERIFWIVLTTIIGVFAIVLAGNMWIADSITPERAISGCVTAVIVLEYLAFGVTSIIELRRAVRLRRQQGHQQSGE